MENEDEVDDEKKARSAKLELRGDDRQEDMVGWISSRDIQSHTTALYARDTTYCGNTVVRNIN